MHPRARRSIAIVAALVTAWIGGAGCEVERTERERLAEARVLVAQGDDTEARELLAELAAAAPADPDVQTQFAAFLVDRGELDAAGRALEAVQEAPMSVAQRERYDAERDRYWAAVRALARGDDLGRPRDRSRYEASLIGLIDVHGGGAPLEEYHAYWIARAWLAIGAPTGDVPPDNVRELVRGVTPGQASEALEALSRLLDGDPSWEAPRPPSDETREHAAHLRGELERRVFADRFHREWRRSHERTLVAEGRFDAARELLLFEYRGAPPLPVDDETPLSRLAWLAQTYVARDRVTAFVADLAGYDGTLDPPLAFDMAEFADVEVDEVRWSDGELRAVVRVPITVVETAAFLLDRRMHST